MIEKLKAVWRRAVVIVAIGGTFSAALWQAMGEQDVDCAQWEKAASVANDIQEQHTFYAARRQGTSLPNGWLCGGGECVVFPSSISSDRYVIHGLGVLRKLPGVR